jgi:glycerol-3-phosphate acyltransferase PlsY
MTVEIITVTIAGYLLGAIPFAYIAGRLIRGVDIRQVGGGNMGALNTVREIGLIPGLIVLVADMGKGAAAVLIASGLGVPLVWVFAAGLASVLGHNWPVFLKFKGGKGGATTIGVLLALMPTEAGISLAIMAVIIIITSNVRLAIAVGLSLLPFIVWQYDGSGRLIIYSLALAGFLLARSLPTSRAAVAKTGEKKNLFIDRNHHFWQSKKNK